MTLKEFIEKNKISISQLAEDLQIPYEYARRYVNEKTIPRPESMQKIIAYTKGEVTANDFYGVEK